jgi:uncharacterized membrane-anchored protein
MKGWIIIAVFAAMAVAQWAVPGSMIFKHERTLSQGELYNFKCQLVDPYDPFRGRYVAVGVDAGAAVTYVRQMLQLERFTYVALERDDEGFARYGAVSEDPPTEGAYLFAYVDIGGRVEFPLDRFYMDEYIAPEAEAVYWDAAVSEEIDAHLAVRILNGHAVIEQLYIENTPVADYVRAKRNEPAPPPPAVTALPDAHEGE